MSERTKKSQSAQQMLLQLKQPFDIKFLKFRVGARTKDKSKGVALFYIDSREVQKRLDDVCGFDGWKSEMKYTPDGVICTLSIKLPSGEWISRTDGGEKSQASPFKGACSDALKRAAVQFGVGRYLYYIPNTWHMLSSGGFNFEDPSSILQSLPAWARPGKELKDWEEVAVQEFEFNQDEINEYEEYNSEDVALLNELKVDPNLKDSIIDALKKKEIQ